MEVTSIQNGIIIDHVPAGTALKVLEYLKIDPSKTRLALIMNADSHLYGTKDIIKIEDEENVNLDVLGLVARQATVGIVRGGKMIGSEHHMLERAGDEDCGEILLSFIMQYYGDDRLPAREILTSHEIPESAVLEELLSEKRGLRVKIGCPQRGEKRRLVEMAGYLAITHLLALQAGDREEYLLSAEIYGKLAASKIEEAYAYVMASTAADVELFKTIESETLC